MDKFHDKEQWLQTFHKDVLALRDILFKGKTAKGAKRLMREMTRRWEKKLGRLGSDDPGAGILAQWLQQTQSHWPGLFHCFSNPYIPHTNNDGEQLILVSKNITRRIANNPNPAVRFMRNGATTMLFVGRSTLPGETFVAACTPAMWARAEKLLQARRRKLGVMQRARKDFDGELKRVMDRVRKASRSPPIQSTMIKAAGAGT